MSSAIEQARASAHGRVHRPAALPSLWRNELLPVHLQDLVYRVSLHRRGEPARYVSGTVPDMEWSDTTAILTGTLNLQLPNAFRGKDHLVVSHGDIVRMDVRWAGSFRTLWDMRIWDPDRTIESGAYTGTLYDDLHQLAISTDDFHFRAHKHKHPDGWYCHEVLMDVARRYRVPLGKISKGTHRIKTLEMTGVSALDPIVRAYRLEREHTGRRFVIKWAQGKLHVVPLVRNPILYALRQQIQNMSVSYPTPDKYATALTGRYTIARDSGTDSKGHAKRKHVKGSALVYGDTSRGFIHDQVELHGIRSHAEAQTRLKHLLANRQRIKRQVQITHALIPFIRRGDATRIALPEYGFSGNQALLWVAQADYHLLAGQPTMDLQFTYDDPLRDSVTAAKIKDQQTREAKRRAHRGRHN